MRDLIERAKKMILTGKSKDAGALSKEAEARGIRPEQFEKMIDIAGDELLQEAGKYKALYPCGPSIPGSNSHKPISPPQPSPMYK